MPEHTDLTQLLLSNSKRGLSEIRAAVEALRAGAEDAELRRTLRRGARSLAASSGALGFIRLARLSHLLEGAATYLQEQPDPVGPALVSLPDETIQTPDASGHHAAIGIDAPVDRELLSRLARVKPNTPDGDSVPFSQRCA